MAITAAQLRMARAALGLSAKDVSDKCGVHPNTLSRIENDSSMSADVERKLIDFYETRGVQFVPESTAEGHLGGVLTFPQLSEQDFEKQLRLGLLLTGLIGEPLEVALKDVYNLASERKPDAPWAHAWKIFTEFTGTSPLVRAEKLEDLARSRFE